MRAVFLDYSTMGPDLDLTPLREIFPDLEIHANTSTEQAATRTRSAEFVFTNKVCLDDALMGVSPALKLIGLTATGTDNIELDAAQRRGIAVCNIRGYCTQSVVEHVFGSLLTLTHSLHRYRASVQAGDWQKADDFCMLTHPIRELSGMTLGIVGYGELGRGVAATARHFGMQVLISVRPGSEATTADRLPFYDILARSDVISLHCPLTDETRNLFGREEFGRMKSSAFLINTARGGLVDARALVAALSNDEIAGAAIDVLKKEPPVDGNALLEYTGDNLLVTPHIAWGTDRARQNAIDELAANVRAFLDGERRNRVV